MRSKSKILALTKVRPKGETQIPAIVRRMLKVKHPDYVAWVLEHGDIIVRKGFFKVVEPGTLRGFERMEPKP